MKIIVITGMSGAGKSLVAKTVEDLGYFCIDNLPPSLIPKFIELYFQGGEKFKNVAFVIDIRGGELLKDLFPGLMAIKENGLDYEVLFLEASDNVLIKRYKESRRSHPLASEGRLVEGIRQEREILSDIKKKADHIIDTSNLTPGQLKEEIRKIFVQGKEFKGLIINIISFGFKYGIPIESDLVFDVRFIPNPYYIESLKRLDGKNPNVRDYVLNSGITVEFLKKLQDLLEFLIPYYIQEGKTQLVISIGCTGGRHRSVAIADDLFKLLSERQYTVVVDHRDIDKDNRGVD